MERSCLSDAGPEPSGPGPSQTGDLHDGNAQLLTRRAAGLMKRGTEEDGGREAEPEVERSFELIYIKR